MRHVRRLYYGAQMYTYTHVYLLFIPLLSFIFRQDTSVTRLERDRAQKQPRSTGLPDFVREGAKSGSCRLEFFDSKTISIFLARPDD